jgi:hypothetical protein
VVLYLMASGEGSAAKSMVFAGAIDGVVYLILSEVAPGGATRPIVLQTANLKVT